MTHLASFRRQRVLPLSTSRIISTQISPRRTSRQRQRTTSQSQVDSINNLSNAILMSAILGMDMPRDRRGSTKRLLLSQFLGGNRQESHDSNSFSSFINRASTASNNSPSQNAGSRGSFQRKLLPGRNIIVQSRKSGRRPLIIETGGQIQVAEIKKANGQTHVVIDTGRQNKPSTTEHVPKTKNTPPVTPTTRSVPQPPTTPQQTGEDPPEQELPQLAELAQLAKLLQAMGHIPVI